MKKLYFYIVLTIMCLFSFSNNVFAYTNWNYRLVMSGTTGWINATTNFTNDELVDTVILNGTWSGYGVISGIGIVIPGQGDIPCYYSSETFEGGLNGNNVSFSAICNFEPTDSFSFTTNQSLGYINFSDTANLSVTNFKLGNGITYFNSNGYTKEILENIYANQQSIGSDVSRLYINSNTMISVLNNLLLNQQSIGSDVAAIRSLISSTSQAQINAINSQTQQQHQDSQELNDNITSDSTTGAESSADDLVNNSAFDDTTGLSAIISMPLTFINTLSNSCSPISLTIPYMNYQFQLPCIQSVVNNYMPSLVVVIKVVVNGLIIYWVMLDIFKIVKNAKNPDDDRIEVLDL